MSLNRLASPAVLILWTAAALTGCTSSAQKAAVGGSEDAALEFPDARVCLVQTSHVLHEVKFYFEMDRVPKQDEEPVFGWLMNLPGQAEEYIAGYEDNPAIQEAIQPGGRPRPSLAEEPRGTHRFSYDHGMFVIGGFRYPAEQYGEIIIFKERPGSFTFDFRGRTITIERSSPWKPAVLFRANREEISGAEQPVAPERQTSPRGRQRVQSRRSTTRIVSEEIQVGPHRIIAAPGESNWTVNNARITTRPGTSITIDRRGEVQSKT